MGAIRLFLALVVAVDHLNLLLLIPAGLGVPGYYTLGMNAGLAVMFFYMISGFLMSMVLSEKYPATMNGTLRFYQSRIIRIFSLYWPLLAFMLFAFGFGGWFASLSAGDKFTNLFIVGMDWRIMLASYPNWHWDAAAPFFHQAWTLGAELTFYLLAPFILRSWKVAIALFVASAATRGYFAATTVFDGRWTYLFQPSTFLFFLIGHFARETGQRWAILKDLRCGLLLLAGSVACLLVRPVGWDTLQFWASSLFFVSALPGIFEGTKRSAFFNKLGDLSFPLYLIHIMVIAEIVDKKMIEKLPRSTAIITLTYLTFTIIAAVLAHRIFEKPAAFAMRRIIGRLAVKPQEVVPG